MLVLKVTLTSMLGPPFISLLCQISCFLDPISVSYLNYSFILIEHILQWLPENGYNGVNFCDSFLSEYDILIINLDSLDQYCILGGRLFSLGIIEVFALCLTRLYISSRWQSSWNITKINKCLLMSEWVRHVLS